MDISQSPRAPRSFDSPEAEFSGQPMGRWSTPASPAPRRRSGRGDMVNVSRSTSPPFPRYGEVHGHPSYGGISHSPHPRDDLSNVSQDVHPAPHAHGKVRGYISPENPPASPDPGQAYGGYPLQETPLPPHAHGEGYLYFSQDIFPAPPGHSDTYPYPSTEISQPPPYGHSDDTHSSFVSKTVSPPPPLIQPPQPPQPPPQRVTQHPPLIKEYGARWEWSAEDKDYVRFEGGTKLFYTVFQKHAGKAPPATGPPPAPPPRVPPKARPWEGPMDPEFHYVAKPKRFFAIGRVFKTVWFEPSLAPRDTKPPRVAPAGRPSSPPPLSPTTEEQTATPTNWTAAVTTFYGFKPTARFRWFIVVRRRLHHSLCFAITTYAARTGSAAAAAAAASGSTRPADGAARPIDYVVLHAASVPPPEPYEEEGITKEPIAVIIEDGEQYISPLARLDCSRLYTVEDGGWAVKIGRVHPESLATLEEYYRECVE